MMQKETGVQYNRMLFYDDENMNVRRVWATSLHHFLAQL